MADGDLVNHADRQYRAWRAFSRSGLVQVMINSLPQSWLARLGEKTAAKMQSTNRYHKSYFPEDQLRARARDLPPGSATLIYGHFHAFQELVEGEKNHHPPLPRRGKRAGDDHIERNPPFPNGRLMLLAMTPQAGATVSARNASPIS